MTADLVARRWHDADGLHLDVRGLPPPQPLVAILGLLREVGEGGAPLTVHLDRDPLMLYPELAEIGWMAQRLSAEPGAVVLRLRRAP
jgi:hypothetical protein